ncbi:MAG: hypothetical protein NC084_04215, partial [Bacteroides sp.]|nr:hypothetical protein [Eubacterium sp.]MCM1417629.1 hypothetical protein [Roseburia sp.]MCM1461906.1 hypothetical protein [Bacteroides sp.]
KQETIDKYHLRILQVHLSEFAGQEDFVQAFKSQAMEILREHITQAQIEEAIHKQKNFIEEHSHRTKEVWNQRAEDEYIVGLCFRYYDIVDIYYEGGVRVSQPFLNGPYSYTGSTTLMRLLYRSDMSSQIKPIVVGIVENNNDYIRAFAVEITPEDIEYQNFRNVDQYYLIEPYGLNLWWLNPSTPAP